MQLLIQSKETVKIQQINCAPVDSDITIIRFIKLKKDNNLYYSSQYRLQ